MIIDSDKRQNGDGIRKGNEAMWAACALLYKGPNGHHLFFPILIAVFSPFLLKIIKFKTTPCCLF